MRGNLLEQASAGKRSRGASWRELNRASMANRKKPKPPQIGCQHIRVNLSTNSGMDNYCLTPKLETDGGRIPGDFKLALENCTGTNISRRDRRQQSKNRRHFFAVR